MNLQLIDSPEPDQAAPKTQGACEDLTMFQKDSVLCEYQDYFSDKPGKLPNKVHLEVDTSVPPVAHPPRKFQLLCWNLQEKSSKRWKKLVLL